MSEARLLINTEEEFELVGDLITIGRASDNTIPLSEDSNVSRYHAEIERRGENEYWIFDLNSSNGTTLNGEKVTGEKPLFDGDVLVLGGTSQIQILLSAEEEEEEQAEEETEDEQAATEDGEDVPEAASAQNAPKLSLLFIVSGLAIGLAVICVFAAGLFYLTGIGGGASGCQATARIINPQTGDILKRKAEIEIDLENGECVRQVTYLMDGVPFASSDSPPFSATLDPNEFPELAANGLDKKLSLELIDENGIKIPQPSEVTLALQTIKISKPKPDETNDPEIDQPAPQNPLPTEPTKSTMSLIDLQKMSNKILPQFAGSFEYNASNPNFLREVNKMTAEYATAGYFQRATKYRDVIAKEFIQNRGLDPPLGFILAMSRTKFEPTNQTDGDGLWRMDNALVQANAYNGSCEAETIAAPTQKCAAIASSLYLKDIIRDVFEGDIIYGIAAFGMSKNEAAAWKATLPPPGQRKDFWNVIKSNKQREQIVRFFAAATVAENPQKFGLDKDQPLSELYRGYMQ